MRISTLAAAGLAFALAGCGGQDTATEADAMQDAAVETPAPQRAVATLQNAAGEPVGTATATAGSDGIAVSLSVQRLPAGERGVHIHMVGLCEAPTFASAGDHWNPDDRRHGLDSPDGPHAGDMPNLTVGADGTGTLEYTLQRGTFDGLLDGDGAAFVVHAQVDDQRTDPSGNSGDRIACGVFRSEMTGA